MAAAKLVACSIDLPEVSLGPSMDPDGSWAAQRPAQTPTPAGAGMGGPGEAGSGGSGS